MSEFRGLDTEPAPDEVRSTLETGDFAIVFQPIVALDTRVVGGYEALTRFRTDVLRTSGSRKRIGAVLVSSSRSRLSARLSSLCRRMLPTSCA